MKKIAALLLALLLVLSLVACGDAPNGDDPLQRADDTTSPQSGNNQGGNNQGGNNTQTNVDIGGILSGEDGSDVVWANADSQMKAELIRQAEAEGITVSFGKDGTTTMTDEEGNHYYQSADGSWSYKSADGSEEIDFSSKWPDNELTRLVPKPSFKVYMSNENEEGCGVTFSDATLDGMKEYAKKLANAGFNIKPDTVDVGEVYRYSASNAAGKFVILTWVKGSEYVEGTAAIGIYHADPLADDDDDDDEPYDDDQIVTAGWQDNEYTRQVPEPNHSVTYASTDSSGFTAAFAGATLEEARAYAQSLQDAGFTIGASTFDDEIEGTQYYIFSAKNSSGYEVAFQYSYGSCTLSINK